MTGSPDTVARHGIMERCHLTDSGYRPLSVSYGSLGIVFRNGVIHAEKPVWRHAFSENHGDGIVRDEHFVHSQLIFQDSTFILEGGTPNDGVCSHTGTTVVNNCDFYIPHAPTSFTMILRAFDGSRNCTYTNNRFHCDGNHRALFSIMGTTPRTNPSRGPDEGIVFAGNLVDASFAGGDHTRRRALVQLQGNDQRSRVADNLIRVHWQDIDGAEVIRLQENGNFSVTGNQVQITTEGTGGAPTGIVLQNCQSGRVTGNIISGTYGHGLRRIGENPRVLVQENEFSQAAEAEAADVAE